MIDGRPLSIGEIAARLNVTISQLRWLEHQGLVSPQLDAAGRRWYLPHVVAFLHWAGDPKQDERKRMGLLVVFYLLITAVLLYFAKRRIWANAH